MVSEQRRFRFPILQGVLPFDRSRVSSDVLAGITLAALAIPEVMGYTRISGTPVVTGLYTILIPMIVYALFGASRHLVVGADSATAAILAGGISAMATPGSAQWLSLAGILALMAASFLFLARLARLGFLADFLSRTVLVGFLTGVGIQVAVGEVSGMLGLPGGGHGTIGRLAVALRQVEEANPASLLLSLSILAVLIGSRCLSRRIPGALIAIVASIVASWSLDLQGYGVRVLGEVPGGLPGITLPAGITDFSLIRTLAPTAFAMFIVILAQSAATSRAYAVRYNEPFNENVDLVGLSLANLGAALSGTFVVNGSPTKTQMVESAGGHSQLSQLTASLCVLLVLLFLTAPLAYLPSPVLSSVVFLIGVELVDLKGMRRILAERPWEFWVALLTACAVVLLGVEQSILLAIVLSLVVHTRHGYLVNNMVVVSDQLNIWRQQKVTRPEEVLPGLMIYRFMHNMYYANTQILTEEVMRLARESQPPLAWFCIDASAVNDVDFTAAEALRRVHAFLAQRGIRLVFCQLVEEVRAEFDRSRLTELIGEDGFFPSIAAVVRGYRQSQRDAGDGGTQS
ncbi:MAG TPA: SulP family inorganic anion transporter [Geomonas sp.]|nr:SulP family inorganic anion transporter [Geomonas sp.]